MISAIPALSSAPRSVVPSLVATVTDALGERGS